jgi:hypothetical protein
MESEACQEFTEGRIKFVHDFSNFLSRCTFSWMQAMLKLGNSRPLELEDLGDLPQVDRAAVNHARFTNVWEAEKTRAARKHATPSLWRSIFLAFKGDILMQAALRLVGDLLSFIGPLCLKQIVTYVEKTLKSDGDDVAKPLTENDVHMPVSEFFGNGFVLSVVILFGNIAATTCINQYFYRAFRFSMNIRACLQVGKESLSNVLSKMLFACSLSLQFILLKICLLVCCASLIK